MDSFELNKIAGAVLAAVLIIVASTTFIEMAHTPHGGGEHEVVGYVLPKPEGEAAAEKHADKGAETDASAPTEKTAAASAAAPAATAAPAAAAASSGFDAAAVAAAVGSADADKGAKLFRKCKACHTDDKGGADKVGPHLWGIVDRAKGSVDGFAYSDALKAKGGNWDNEALAAFLHKPKDYIDGTKMIFSGFKKNDDVANIVAYLNTLK